MNCRKYAGINVKQCVHVQGIHRFHSQLSHDHMYIHVHIHNTERVCVFEREIVLGRGHVKPLGGSSER